MDSKAEDSRNVCGVGREGIWHQVTEGHEEEMGKCRAEGGTIDPGTATGADVSVVVTTRSNWRGVVNTLTFGAEDFDRVSANLILDPHREHRLTGALNQWAGSKLLGSIL